VAATFPLVLEKWDNGGQSSMTYESGDFVKVEFKDERTGQSERMWVKVESVDNAARVVFGRLDNEPMLNKAHVLDTFLFAHLIAMRPL
jgi:hypothetical protein